MSKLPNQVELVLRKYNKEPERIVHKLSEEEFKRSKNWLLEHPERIIGGVEIIARKDGKFVLVRHTPESWGTSHRLWAFPGGGLGPFLEAW